MNGSVNASWSANDEGLPSRGGSVYIIILIIESVNIHCYRYAIRVMFFWRNSVSFKHFVALVKTILNQLGVGEYRWLKGSLHKRLFYCHPTSSRAIKHFLDLNSLHSEILQFLQLSILVIFIFCSKQRSAVWDLGPSPTTGITCSFSR